MARKKTGLGRGLEAIMGSDSHTNMDRPVRKAYGQKQESAQDHYETPSRKKSKKSPTDVFFEPTSNKPSTRPQMPAVDSILGHDRTHGHSQASEGNGGVVFDEIPVDTIVPNRQQPRTIFDQDELDELAESIAEVGILQPIVVRRQDDGFELIMGERRWRATRQAGLKVIPALIRETADDDLLRDALVENIHRSQLNPLEEAAAYEQLLRDFGITQSELSQRLTKSRAHITNTIRLLRLPSQIQKRVASGVLSAGHARALLGLDNEAAMQVVADRIVSEGLSVRATEEIVALGLGLRPEKVRRSKVEHTEPNSYPQEDRLMDLLDTKVSVKMGQKKGRIVIDFADSDDLDRIMSVIEHGQH